jgi:chromate transporter
MRPVPEAKRIDVTRLAAWLGLTGFGGGYAVLAQIERAVVERHRWLTRDEFGEIASVAQSLPGASAANFFTLLGLRAGGVGGAALATVGFLAPSAILMIAFGAAYSLVHDVARVDAILAGMNVGVVAAVVQVAWTLGRRLRRPWQLAVAVAALAGVELGIGVFEIVASTIVITCVAHAYASRAPAPKPPPLVLAPSLLVKLTLVFLRIGASGFGGGLALIPILDHEVVGALGWLTPREFSDAVTLGQITPGPVAITATFVGYRVAGAIGALVGTVAVFAPPFVASVLAGRSIARFRGSPWTDAILGALAPAVVGIVAAAALSLGRAALHSRLDVAIAGVCLVLLVWRRWPVLVVIALAAIVGAVRL